MAVVVEAFHEAVANIKLDRCGGSGCGGDRCVVLCVGVCGCGGVGSSGPDRGGYRGGESGRLQFLVFLHPCPLQERNGGVSNVIISAIHSSTEESSTPPTFSFH